MRPRYLPGLAAVSLLFAACSPRAEGPAVVAADGAVAVIPSASSAAVTPAASAAASAPAAELPPLPPSPEALAQLPPDAPAYFSVRLGAIAQATAARPDMPAILAELTRRMGGKSPQALLAAAGVDPRRPVLGAIAATPEKSARAVVDGMAAGSSTKDMAKLVREHAQDATLARLLVPLASGTAPAAAGAILVEALANGASMEACPAAAACQAFGAAAPIGVARSGRMVIAAYADGADLRLDAALPLFVDGADPAALPALVTFGASRGGFTGRCSRFDPAATLSVCLDAHGMGDMGATQGYGMTVKALAEASIDPSQRRRIAAAGRTESMRNLELAAPARKLAQDGTLVGELSGAHPRALWSWSLTDASRPAVEKAFTAERCAEGRAVTAELLPALRAAFGDPGPGFTDPRKTFESFLEAGWAAYAIALAGSWPNLLDVFTSASHGAPVVPSGLRGCVRAEAGRLVLRIN